MQKLLIYLLLLVCSILMCLSLSILSPFFPPLAMERGVTEDVLGLIISVNPLGAFASLTLGKKLNDKNRFFYMILGIMFETSGLFLFGSAYYLDTKIQIICVGIFGRIMTGLGASCFLTSFYAYIPIIYPNEVEKRIAISELTSGLGFLIGPIIGSLLFSLGGYTLPFIVFGGLTCIITPFVYFLITRFDNKKSINLLEPNEPQPQQPPSSASADNSDISEESIRTNDLDHKKYKNDYISGTRSYPDFNVPSSQSLKVNLNYLSVLSKYPVFINFLSNAMINFVIMYFAPTLVFNLTFFIYYSKAQFLEDSYNANPSNVGLLMSVYALTYTISSLIATLISKHKKMYIFGSIILVGLSFLSMGPDKQFTGLDPHLWIVLFSQGMIGFGVANVVILSLPILNELLLYYYPGQHLQCANISSVLYNSSSSIGELIGPIASGFLTKHLGFPRGCAYTGLGILFVGLLYSPLLFKKFKLSDNKKSFKSDSFASQN